MMLGGQGGGDEVVAMPPGGEGLKLAPGGLMSASTTADDVGKGTSTAPADPEVAGKLPTPAGEEVVSEAAKLPPPGEGLPKMSASGGGEPSAPGGGVKSGRGRKKLSGSSSASQTEGGGSAPPGGGHKISAPEGVSRTGKAKGSIQSTPVGVTGPSSPQQPAAEGPPPPQKFANKEKVLCYYGTLLYEAKVLKSSFRDRDREWTYLIHYNGWNKKWDGWVDEARLLKYSDENLKLQADLKDANDKEAEAAPNVDSPAKAKASSSGPGRKSLTSDAATGTGRGDTFKAPAPSGSGSSTPGGASGQRPGGRKRGARPKLEVKIDIPEKLKLLLADDWNEVVGESRVTVIPARVTIEQIFTEYLQGKNRDDVDVCAGIKDYFNALIGTQLLYPSERKQYEELLTRDENKEMTDYYGVAHLMRLFTKLGGCLTSSDLEPEVISVLHEAIPNFFKFLLEKYDAYYSAEDYIGK